MNDIMLDIETLGTKPGCVILSIGAVEFNSKGEFGKDFEVIIDVDNSSAWGLKIEPRTVMWWMDQNENARKKISSPGHDLNESLESFTRAFDWKNSQVWCNGASFDFPILDAAFNSIKRKKPWPYYNERCFRTIKGLLSKEVFDKLKVSPKIPHSALEDAKAQALTLINIMNHTEGFGLKAA